MKKAFTMIELIFVIVVIGILAGIAIPKLTGTVDKAYETKGKNTLAAVRSTLATERQKRILRSNFKDITSLSGGFGTYTDEDGTYTLLDNPVRNGCTQAGCWDVSGTTHTFYYSGGSCEFELENNKLTGSCGVFGN